MNRPRLFVAFLGAIFVAAVGIGVVVGDDRPMQEVSSADLVQVTTTVEARPTTTVPRTTTTKAPATTTTTGAPTTTVAPRVVTTRPPVVSAPPSTQPPITQPPTTVAPTTSSTLGYDPVKCADTNTQYLKANAYDDPTRVPLLKLYNCPPYYW